MGRDSLNFRTLFNTEAFQRRNKEWPWNFWDYTEWEECMQEAEGELKRKLDKEGKS